MVVELVERIRGMMETVEMVRYTQEEVVVELNVLSKELEVMVVLVLSS